MPGKPRLRMLMTLVGLVATALYLFIVAGADAREGGNLNSGNRGVRTMSVPPTTRTPPKSTTQVDRSAMQTGTVSGVIRPVGVTTNNVVSRPGLFGGLFAGFLGAGLFGFLTGNGIVGGIGGSASIVGLLLQIALVLLAARLVWMWWQRRHAPAAVGLSPRELADAYGRSRSDGTGREADTSAAVASDEKRERADQR